MGNINKNISIPIELYEKLKLEDNASGLICSLLIAHYNSSKFDGFNKNELLEYDKLIDEEQDIKAKKENIIRNVRKR